MVYSTNTPPEQSLASFEMAYNAGYRILLCDVRTTLDGEFVCLHDTTINSVARNTDGTEISETININDITLAQADEYDFGIKKSEAYAGTKILRLTEFLELCKRLDVCPHLELKESFSDEKRDEIIALIKKYGFEDNVMFNGLSNDMRYIAPKLPNAIMGQWVQAITDNRIKDIATFGDNKKFIYVSNGYANTITAENYAKCLENGIDIGYTEIRSKAELAAIKELGVLKYCTYVATRIFDLTTTE